MSATLTSLAAPAKRGFADLPCIKCGVVDGVHLVLLDCETFTCTECNEEFTVEDVRAQLAKWAAVVEWIALAPAIGE